METNKKNNLKMEIWNDEFASSPREMDENMGKMICFSQKYNFGDKHDYKSKNYNNCQELEKAIMKKENGIIILPIFKYEHSGIVLGTSNSQYPFNCPWDSCQIGFIVASKESILKTFGGKRITKKMKEKAILALQNEVETYSKWISGEIYRNCFQTC